MTSSGSDTLMILLKSYMEIGEVVSEQALFMDRSMNRTGRSRYLTCTVGHLPFDMKAECVIIAEPDAYSIVAMKDDKKDILLQCMYKGGESVVVDGKFADQFIELE